MIATDVKRYESFEFLYPPRPTSAILPTQFGYFERKGFVSQFKLNGTCSIIGIGPGDEVQLWNRHQEPLKWSMPDDLQAKLKHACGSAAWTVLVAELMHSKVKGGPKNTLYVHDLLVWNGEYLVGRDYRYRIALVYDVFGAVEALVAPSHFVVHDNLWLARTFTGGTTEMFSSITPGGILEGVVLKNPDATLEECSKESANSRWCCKCRFANKNLAY